MNGAGRPPRIAAGGGGAAAGKRAPRQRPRLPRHKEVLSAGALVAETLAQHGLTEAIRTYRVTAEWDQLVGERIARRARPGGITRRVLHIQVASSAWLHELGLLKAQLLDVLWRALGEPRLFDDLSFHLAGKSRAPADAPGAAPHPRPAPRGARPLPPARPRGASLG